MLFSTALISFLSSLSTAASVAMAMEEPHDSVLHDITASILEESFKVKYKNKKNQENTPSPFSKIKTSNNKYKKLMSHLEPLQIQKSNDGRRYKASGTIADLADDKDDIMQKKEVIHHLVEHQQHQERKSLEECNISPTTTTTATSDHDHDSFMKQKVSSNRESITKIDYGNLNRGTCSSSKDVCVPQDKAIEGDGAFLKPEDASYASSGYCVPLPLLEDMEYKNVVATTMSLIDKEEFNKEEEMTDSYYHYHPQYDHHHRQLHSLNCTSLCPGPRLDVSSFNGFDFFYFLTGCYNNGDCTSDYPDISCWNTAGITEMDFAFDSYFRPNYFNDPLECWDVGQVTSMIGMFSGNFYFNQPLDSWNVSQVEYMSDMFYYASDFNQCLSTWAEKTPDNVSTRYMLNDTDCPDGIGYPNATIGPWCQDYTQGCFAPGFEPSQQPSDIPSNKPTDVPTNAPTNSPTTKSQKKKSIKKTKKQRVKKKSKKM